MIDITAVGKTIAALRQQTQYGLSGCDGGHAALLVHLGHSW